MRTRNQYALSLTIIQLFLRELEFLNILLFVYIYWKSLPFPFAISLLMSCVGVFAQVNIDHLLVIQIYDLLSPCHQLFSVKHNLILKELDL